MVWLFRFQHWLKKATGNHDTSLTMGPLTTEELRKTETAQAKYVQATEYPKWIKYLSGKTSRVVNKSSSLWKLSPFLNDGSIRVGERLGWPVKFSAMAAQQRF